MLSTDGRFEVAPSIQAVDLDGLVLSDAIVDYVYGGEPPPEVKRVATAITETARASLNNPHQRFRVRRLAMQNGTLGIVNRTQDPPYRIYFSNADFTLENLSSRAEDGPAEARLAGSFMGSGKVDGSATFYPEGKSANFGLKLGVENTELRSLNDMLRAHGNFDVVAGTLSVFTQMRVKDGYIEGYVKPLFRDIQVYSREQDKNKGVFHRMYEGIVGGLAHLLENKNREVATVASLAGPIENPKSSTLEIIGGLLRNAFVRAILPGFLGGAAEASPRVAKNADRAERKQQKKQEKRERKKREKQKEEDERASLTPRRGSSGETR
jgi:hypothetical protein